MSDRIGPAPAPQAQPQPHSDTPAPAEARAPDKRKRTTPLEPRASTDVAGESAAARPRSTLPVPARVRPPRQRPPALGPQPHAASPAALDETHATPAVQPTLRAQELDLNPLAAAPRPANVDLALRLRRERLVELLSVDKGRHEPRATQGRLVDRILEALRRNRS